MAIDIAEESGSHPIGQADADETTTEQIHFHPLVTKIRGC
jgi:hypothetical protein